MRDEQTARFESMRQLVDEARQAIDSLSQMTHSGLRKVNHDSPDQAEQLQRIQKSAGTAVQALTQLADLARHARSYQAQAHQRHSGGKPR